MNWPIIQHRTHLLRVSAVLAVMLWVSYGQVSTVLAEPRVTVFAAASLKNALDQVAAEFERTHTSPVSISYAGSSALARQIQYGAPAQVFVSANSFWMDFLATQAALAPTTRVTITSNQLVLIAAPGNPVNLKIAPGMDLIAALNGKRLAMALVQAVPAGIYGRKALISLGVWEAVQAQIAQSDNVRAALRLVALGQASLGIVYATDAVAEPRVRVLGVFPPEYHPKIVYPAAILKDGDTANARAFLSFLTGPEAQEIFNQHGFLPTRARPHD